MNASVRPAHEVANDHNAFVRVKSCHLAHRFSQTCIPLFRRLCGIMTMAETKTALTGPYSGAHSPFRCIAAVVQALINRTQPDGVSE